MFDRIAIRRIVVLSALAGASACDASTAPSSFVAEYALVSLASQALPAAPYALGSATTVLSDTVRLRSDGTGVRIVRENVGNLRMLFEYRVPLTWREIGDSLEVSFPCDDRTLASCIAPPHLAGRLGAGMQWVIPRARIYNDAPAVYQRVGMR